MKFIRELMESDAYHAEDRRKKAFESKMKMKLNYHKREDKPLQVHSVYDDAPFTIYFDKNKDKWVETARDDAYPDTFTTAEVASCLFMSDGKLYFNY